jgi:hypothetical protein
MLEKVEIGVSRVFSKFRELICLISCFYD